MATKNFLYIVRNSLALLFLVSCAQLKTRSQIPVSKEKSPETKSAETPAALTPSEAPAAAVSLPPQGSVQKVGLILGPGALRMFGHIGVIEELVRAKIPITQVVGLETGALVGGLYAQKGQAYDVEWQLFKLKEDEILSHGIMGAQKSYDVKALSSFLSMTFSNLKMEDSKISFSCPAYNLAKQETFMMNKGPYTATLPYCLPLPPLMKSYNQNVAAVMDLKGMVDYLKSKGAQYIIYVNVLTSKNGQLTKDDDLNSFWGLVNQAIMKNQVGIDYTVHVQLQEFDILDFNHRRDMLQKGKEAGAGAASEIAAKLGL